MINQFQVQAYLLNELPDIATEFKKIYPSISVFKAMQCLANYTRQVVLQRDIKSVKKCFIVANNIYIHGTLVVRNAIETVYVHSLWLLAATFKTEQKKEMQSLMPLYLYSAYHQRTISQ